MPTWVERLEEMSEIRRREGSVRAYALQQIVLSTIVMYGEEKAASREMRAVVYAVLDSMFGKPPGWK